MASNVFIGAGSLGRQDLAQRYLDIFEARKDAFELPTINDFDDLQESTVTFQGNRLIAKAAQLVLDLESIDKQQGLIFDLSSDISSIISKYEDAADSFGKIAPDADVREELTQILNDLEDGLTEELALDQEV